MNEGSADSMLSFEEDALYRKLRGKFIFTMPRVVPDQRVTFQNDELFRKLSRESEVKYTGFRDRPLEERQLRFQAECREGKADLAFVPTGTSLTLTFSANSWSDRPEDRIPTREFVDFDVESGKVHLKSQFILNGVCVVWIGWVDLIRLDGVGCLAFDEERAQVEDAALRDQIEQNNRRVQEFEERRRQHQQEQERQAASEAEAVHLKHRHRSAFCPSIGHHHHQHPNHPNHPAVIPVNPCNRCVSVRGSGGGGGHQHQHHHHHHHNDRNNTNLNSGGYRSRHHHHQHHHHSHHHHQHHQHRQRCSSSGSNNSSVSGGSSGNVVKDDKHSSDVSIINNKDQKQFTDLKIKCDNDHGHRKEKDDDVVKVDNEEDSDDIVKVDNEDDIVVKVDNDDNDDKDVKEINDDGDKVFVEDKPYERITGSDVTDDVIKSKERSSTTSADSSGDAMERLKLSSPPIRNEPCKKEENEDEDMDVEIEVKSEAGDPEPEIEVEIIDEVDGDAPPKSPEKPKKSEKFWSPWK